MTAIRNESLLEQIPSSTEVLKGAEPTRVGIDEKVFNRRRVLGSMLGIGIAAGLGLLDLLPWSKPRAAFAAPYQQWNDCRGYWSSSQTCVPSNALFSGNCSGTWHRNDGSSGTCYNFRYTHNGSACDGRNAWRWTGRGAHRKCSDGYYEYNDCGGGRISRFSICRTAI